MDWRSRSILFAVVGIWLAFHGVGAFAADQAPSAPKARRFAVPDKIKNAKSTAPKKKSRLTSDASEELADHRELTLGAGINQVIDLDFTPNTDPLKGITVGNDKVVIATLVNIGESNQLVLRPVAQGDTNMILRDATGEIKLVLDIHVANSDLIALRDDIRKKLKEVEGITIDVNGKRIDIDGEVIVPQDYGRVYAVVSDKKFSEFISSYVTLSPLALQTLAKKIQDEVQTFAPKVTTRVVNSQIWVQGSVESDAVGKRAWDVANFYVPASTPMSLIDKDPTVTKNESASPIRNMLTVEAAPAKKRDKMIRITVHIVELSKDYAKVFGFKWEPAFTADPTLTVGPGATDATGATSGSSLNLTATLSSLIPKLQTAQNAGFARVLKTANLITRSGQKATLEDSQQIPITGFVGAGGQQIGGQVANVGFNVEINPRVLGQGENIEMAMAISERSVTGIRSGQPIVGTRKMETNVYLRNNDSAALGGLNSTDVTTNFNRDDPRSTTSSSTTTSPLFSLLRSKNYQKRRGQFVLFVTPTVVDDATEGSEELKKNFRVKVK